MENKGKNNGLLFRKFEKFKNNQALAPKYMVLIKKEIRFISLDNQTITSLASRQSEKSSVNDWNVCFYQQANSGETPYVEEKERLRLLEI